MNEDSPSRVVVVLGMHRSGTSLIARGLKALGVELGTDLMAPNEYNERGYWENDPLVDINDELLAGMGMAWWSLALPDEGWLALPHTKPLLAKAVAELRRQFHGQPLWGFKDPRTVRLLPFWERALEHVGAKPFYVVAIRNPLSVIPSLAKRDGFVDAAHAQLMWLEHTAGSLLETDDRPRIVVDYDGMMRHPEQELKRIAQALGLNVTPRMQREIDDFTSEFVSKELRHTQFWAEDLALDPSIAPLLTTTFAVASRLAAGEDANAATLRSVWDGLCALAPIWRLQDARTSAFMAQQEQMEALKRASDEQAAAHREATAALERRLDEARRTIEEVLARERAALEARDAADRATEAANERAAAAAEREAAAAEHAARQSKDEERARAAIESTLRERTAKLEAAMTDAETQAKAAATAQAAAERARATLAEQQQVVAALERALAESERHRVLAETRNIGVEALLVDARNRLGDLQARLDGAERELAHYRFVSNRAGHRLADLAYKRLDQSPRLMSIVGGAARAIIKAIP